MEPTKTLWLVGAGRMGYALLKGWLEAGIFQPQQLCVFDPHPSSAILDLQGKYGFICNPEMTLSPDVLVLAIKPQVLEQVMPSFAWHTGSQTLVISILAGKTIASLEKVLPHTKAFVRAMPNLPASIGIGATGAFGVSLSPKQKSLANHILQATGLVTWLDDENLIDAVTAVSGSGPAYVFYMVECLAKAGEELGLPPDTSLQLARETIIGAGALLKAETLSPSALREAVTSPKGTTQAALDVLMSDTNGLSPLLSKAVKAAGERAQELANT